MSGSDGSLAGFATLEDMLTVRGARPLPAHAGPRRGHAGSRAKSKASAARQQLTQSSRPAHAQSSRPELTPTATARLPSQECLPPEKLQEAKRVLYGLNCGEAVGELQLEESLRHLAEVQLPLHQPRIR
jgi:hypothetical protein